jgi:glyoxylate reductase
VQGHRYCAEGHFTEYKNMLFLGKAVAGTTLGIVGLGRIGEQVARRAQGFGMKVLYHNRHRRVAEEAALGVQYAGLEELLGQVSGRILSTGCALAWLMSAARSSQSDYVVLCCPCTAATQHLLNASRLRLMKVRAQRCWCSRHPPRRLCRLIIAAVFFTGILGHPSERRP